jgi:hypothetical protein
MPIKPRIAHDDLVVHHEIVTGEDGKEVYLGILTEPDGTATAPAIVFHKGSPVQAWHGWTTAKVIEALIKHMDFHQSTPFACEQNEEILGHLQAAHKATEKRRDERKDRGVLYDSEKP